MMKRSPNKAINPILQLIRPSIRGKRRRGVRYMIWLAGAGCALLVFVLLLNPGGGKRAAEPEARALGGGQETILGFVAQNKMLAWEGSRAVFQGMPVPPATSSSILMAAEEAPIPEAPEATDADGAIEFPSSTPGLTEPGEPTLSPTPSATPEPTPEITPEPTPTPFEADWDEWIDFYMVEADQYYNEMGYSSNAYEYTENDIYMLAQVIYGEARGESTKGKIAVGNVVMNRVLARGYPGNTIEEVIKASGQFTGYSSSIRPNSSCKAAAKQVLEKQVWVIPQDVYFFNSDRPAGQDWGGHSYYTKIDGHCFYRESYSGRNRNGEVPPALFERTFKWPQYGCKSGKRVSRIQFMLNQLGYKVKADGYFGITSKVALMEFQNDNKMEADGVAGPSTIKALIKAYGVEKYHKKYK